MLRPARSFRKHAETEDIQHEEVYGGAAAHGELSLQVGVSPQVCVIQGTPSTAASSRSPLVLTVSTCYMVVGGSLSYLQVPGESPGYFYSFHQESPLAKELSVFVNESDDRGGKARYYLLTLVFHDQADSIAEAVTGYEAKLARADLPNIPFHSEPLMNGHKDYEFLGIEQRKAMLAYFSSFIRRLPISYTTFVYRRSQFEDPTRLMERMGRDISSAMVEHLDFFQSFDDVKVYYDNGQDIVKQALDRSVGKVLSKGVVRRRKTSMTDYRLEQVADYLCTIELALVKYEAKENGETYNKFFGGIGSFKRNWLKQARSKRI